jgi:hypothetical protein
MLDAVASLSLSRDAVLEQLGRFVADVDDAMDENLGSVSR